MAEPLEVLIVEDHLAVRRGVELLLSGAGFRVAGVAASVDEARGLLQRRRHDVALVDITLGDGSAIGLIGEVRVGETAPPIVLYTGSADPLLLQSAAHAGAAGLVLKSAPPSVLIGALTAVARGGTFVDPDLAAALVTAPATAWDTLSPREQEVIALLATGLSGEQIAAHLYLSPETVKTHVRNAMRGLDARTRVHAVALAMRAGAPQL